MSAQAHVLVAATAKKILASSRNNFVRIRNSSAGDLYIKYVAAGEDTSGDDVTAADGTFDICVPTEITLILTPSEHLMGDIWGFKTAGGSINVSVGA